MPPMDEEHAFALLEKKIPNTAQTQHDHKDMVELVQALDYMPLAVTQAGAYIRQRASRCSVRQYIEKLERSDKSRTSLLDRDERNLRRDKEASNSIILTWQMSFEHIRDNRPSAADLLALMSFCDRQGIPEFLLRASEDKSDAVWENHDDDNDDQLHERSAGIQSPDSDASCDSVLSIGEDDAFEEDLVTLEGYSFISKTTNPSTFEMHNLVQLSTRRWLEAQGSAQRWKERFVRNLDIVFPSGEYENWTMCQALLPHAQAATLLKMGTVEASLQWASVMYHASWYARERGMYAVSVTMSELCSSKRTMQLGKTNLLTLYSISNLALAYRKQGRWEEAEQLDVEVTTTMGKVLGDTHLLTLTSMRSLATTYYMQGRWDEAEELNVKVTETRKKVLGEAHPDTLSSMANLAATYRSQERPRDADDLEQAVLLLRQNLELGR